MMRWSSLVALACLVVVAAFSVLFRYDVSHPYLLSVPYILWAGLAATIALVLLTYLGAKYFPYKED